MKFCIELSFFIGNVFPARFFLFLLLAMNSFFIWHFDSPNWQPWFMLIFMVNMNPLSFAIFPLHIIFKRCCWSFDSFASIFSIFNSSVLKGNVFFLWFNNFGGLKSCCCCFSFSKYGSVKSHAAAAAWMMLSIAEGLTSLWLIDKERCLIF